MKCIPVSIFPMSRHQYSDNVHPVEEKNVHSVKKDPQSSHSKNVIKYQFRTFMQSQGKASDLQNY